MVLIYKITNIVNNKVYIGKTSHSTVQERWKEHCSDAYKSNNTNRPLYSAIRKYGASSFQIDCIEKVETDKIACERESFWIDFYRSYVGFSDAWGYNATLGGDGKAYISEEEKQDICKSYLNLKNMSLVAQNFQRDVGTVSKILKDNNITVQFVLQNPIIMKDRTTGKILYAFENQCDAGRWIQEQGLTKSTNVKKVSYMIGRAVRKERPTAFGYVWDKQ